MYRHLTGDRNIASSAVIATSSAVIAVSAAAIGADWVAGRDCVDSCCDTAQQYRVQPLIT